MKTHFSLITVTLFLCFLSISNAQDGYTYTLSHDGGYNFTVQAVPNTSSNNFATSVQSYGFTIIVPDGITITSVSSLGGTANPTFFDGINVAQPTIDGYLITETLGSPVTLSAPSAATNSNIFSFTVNGNPTSGELKILENNSALATTVTPLKSFMQADMIDNGSAQFVNVIDPNAAAVSGMSTFNFTTLHIPEITLEKLSIYPNPTTDKLYINQIQDLVKIEVININGQLVLTKEKGLQAIDVSHLQNGGYFIKTFTKNRSMVKKFIKN